MFGKIKMAEVFEKLYFHLRYLSDSANSHRENMGQCCCSDKRESLNVI